MNNGKLIGKVAVVTGASKGIGAGIAKELAAEGALTALDALVIAVPHRSFLDRPLARYLEALVPGGVVVDIKSALDPRAVPEGITYWSL